MKIYVASKTKHAPYWRHLRQQGVPIISTWIDEAEPGQTKDPAELAQRCLKEVSECDWLLFYAQEGEEPKGAFVEVGCALTLGKVIRAAVHSYKMGIFKFHPLAKQFYDVIEALNDAGIYHDENFNYNKL